MKVRIEGREYEIHPDDKGRVWDLVRGQEIAVQIEMLNRLRELEQGLRDRGINLGDGTIEKGIK